MDQDRMAEARKNVINSFGSDLARKASDALIIRLGLLPHPEEEDAETIIEVNTEEHPPTKLPNRSIEESDWQAIKNTIGALIENESATRELYKALRHARINIAKDNFYKSCKGVRFKLEVGKEFAQMPNREGAQAARQILNDLCWLNGTILTRSGAKVLAEVAQDPVVSHLSTSRRLEFDAMVSANAVGVNQFKNAKNNVYLGQDIVIAVIDSEVAVSHPALVGRVVPRRNYTKEPWGSPGNHGTAVAGIIAGDISDSFQGIAPAATIYNYKVLAENKLLSATDFYFAVAIEQALEDGVDIANCSFGNGPIDNNDPALANAFNNAWALGLTIVKSAGNGGALTSPAEANGVIVVGATDHNGQEVQSYSGRGTLPNGQARPHLVAPGGTVALGMTTCLTNGGIGVHGHGTSLAAAVVSGMLALLLEQAPNMTPDDLRSELLRGCKRLTQHGIEAGMGLPYLA